MTPEEYLNELKRNQAKSSAIAPAIYNQSSSSPSWLNNNAPYSPSNYSNPSYSRTRTQGGSNAFSELPSWAKGLVGKGVGMLGSALKMPSYVTSPLSAIASGIVNNESPNKVAHNIGNSAIGWGLSAINPVAGTLYSLGKMLGLDVIRGVSNLVNPNEEVPESWRGGFFAKGYAPEEGSYMSSGNRNYSPYGGSSTSSSSNSSGYAYHGAENTGNENYSRYGGSAYSNSSDDSGDSSSTSSSSDDSD